MAEVYMQHADHPLERALIGYADSVNDAVAICGVKKETLVSILYKRMKQNTSYLVVYCE